MDANKIQGEGQTERRTETVATGSLVLYPIIKNAHEKKKAFAIKQGYCT